MISRAPHLQCPTWSLSYWVSALGIWKIQRNVYTHVMAPKTTSCNCNLISRPSTCLRLSLHFLSSSVVLPKTEEMDRVRGLISKTQEIFLILYLKVEVLDKGKKSLPANQKPNWAKPKTPRPSLQVKFQLSWPWSP